MLPPTLPSSLSKVALTGATLGSTTAGLRLHAPSCKPCAMVPIWTAGVQQMLSDHMLKASRMLSMLLEYTEWFYPVAFGHPRIIISSENPCVT